MRNYDLLFLTEESSVFLLIGIIQATPARSIPLVAGTGDTGPRTAQKSC